MGGGSAAQPAMEWCNVEADSQIEARSPFSGVDPRPLVESGGVWWSRGRAGGPGLRLTAPVGSAGEQTVSGPPEDIPNPPTPSGALEADRAPDRSPRSSGWAVNRRAPGVGRPAPGPIGQGLRVASSSCEQKLCPH